MKHCRESVQIRSFFWSVTSHIRTEYGKIRSISPFWVSLCIQSEYRKIRTRKNSVFGHFSHGRTWQRFQSIGKENVKFPNNLYGDLLYPIASHCIRVYTSCKNISSSKPGEQSSGSAHLCENTTFPSIIIMKWKILYKILYMNMSNFKQ